MGKHVFSRTYRCRRTLRIDGRSDLRKPSHGRVSPRDSLPRQSPPLLTGLKSAAFGFGLKTNVEAPGLSLALAAAGETAAEAPALWSTDEALPSSPLTWGTATSAVDSRAIGSALTGAGRWKGGISGMTILILFLIAALVTG